MRIEKLRLKSYGHFTDAALDFSAAPFVVLAGPNEAGKTTLLASVRALLYGFGKSPLSNHAAAAVTATLSLRDGGRAELKRYRRTQTKEDLAGSLVTSAGVQQPFGADALVAALGGVDQATYSGVFGFRLDELEAGADGLTAAGLDTVLAGGALGGTAQAVRDLQEALEKQLSELFSAHANVKRRKLNDVLQRAKRAAEQRDAATLRHEMYGNLVRTIAQLTRDMNEVRSSLERLRTGKARAERLARVHGDAVAFRETALALSGAPAALLYPAEAERATQLVSELREHRKLVGSLEKELAVRTEQLAAIVVDQRLLAGAAAIDALHARTAKVGELRTTIEASESDADARERELLQQASVLHEGITVESLAARSVPRRVRDEIGRLLDCVEDAQASAGKERAVLESTQKRVEAAKKRLAEGHAEPSAELNALYDELEEFRRECDAARAHETDATRSVNEAARKGAALDPSLPSTDLSTIALPSLDFVTDVRSRWDGVRKRVEDAEFERQERRAELAAKEAELATLLHEQHVPDPAELEPARARRSEGWSLVRRAWLGHEDVVAEAARYAPGSQLEDAYEASVTEADRVVDSLRSAARNVERVEQLRREVAGTRAAEQTWLGAQAKAGEDFEALRREWTTAWAASGVRPREPAAMASWLPGAEEVRTLHANAAREREAASAASERIAAFVQRAAGVLQKDVNASTVAAAVRRAHKASNDAAIRADELRRELETASSEVEIARRSTETWNAEVDEAASALRDTWPQAGVPADLPPKQGSEWLKILDALSDSGRELVSARQTLRRDRETLAAFDAEAGALLERFGRAAVPSTNAAVDQLHRELRQAELAATRRDEVARDVEARSVKLAQVTADGEGLQSECAELLARVSAADEAALLIVAQDSQRRHGLEAERDELSSRLAMELGSGPSRADDDAELETRTRAELEAEAEKLQGEIAALEGRRDELGLELGARQKEHEGLGGTLAATAEAERLELVTEAQRWSEEVAALQVAKLLLERSVERYGRESRPTILARASALMQRLTGGRWTAIEREPSGRIELVSGEGVRRGPVELSRGTREQLFLALRLAFVLERSGVEPLPLLLDDVLVNFDPVRARAAMGALAEVSRETQVLYLTCHPQLADLAEEHGARVVTLAM